MFPMLRPKVFLLLVPLLAACNGAGHRCYSEENAEVSVLVSSDPVFQTIDIGAEPTHVQNASWVEEISVKQDGSFRLITVQKHIRADRTLGKTRTLRVLDLSKKVFTAQDLPDGKVYSFSCTGSAGSVDFLFEIMDKI